MEFKVGACELKGAGVEGSGILRRQRVSGRDDLLVPVPELIQRSLVA